MNSMWTHRDLEECGPYHLPVLSSVDAGLFRSHGPGLGNLLFPISRAIIGRKEKGGTLIYPTLRQAKLGPIIRGERDWRTYGGEFRPRSRSEWVAWWKAKMALHQSKRKLGEENTKQKIITYNGLGGYFHDLQHHRELIKDWINKNALPRGSLERPYEIGIHVRLGDFKPQSTSGTGHSIRQDMSWYREAYSIAIRREESGNASAVLFTDDDPAAVAEALKIPNLRIDPSRNAISAIMNLSLADTIITSRSTFSMWAAFLGNKPAIWDKRMDLRRSLPLRDDLDLFL